MLKLFRNKKINFSAGFVLAGLIIGLVFFIVFGSDLYNSAYSTPAPPAPQTTQSEGEFRMAATPCFGSTFCANDQACIDMDDLCRATTGGGIACYSNCDLTQSACECCCEASGTAATACASGFYQTSANNTWMGSSCCGDDASEVYEECVQRVAGEMAWTCTSSQYACCTAASCVYGSTCKAAGNQTGLGSGADNVAYCYSTGYTWYDCDMNASSSDSYCDASDWCTSLASKEAKSGEGSTSYGEYSDNSTVECCGDDSGENYRTLSCGASTPCTSDSTEKACCNASTDCEFTDPWLIPLTQTCSSQGYCGLKGVEWTEKASCSSGTWTDPDTDSTVCGYCSGAGWITSGESTAFGEYPAGTPPHTTECCTDDSGENYKTGGLGTPNTGCCNSSTDCIESGVCKVNFSESSLCMTSCAKGECDAGTWQATAICSGSVLCSGSSCTTTCEADCSADTWADARTRGTCAAGGTSGCPSGSRCCAGNGTSGTSCKAYDDDNSSAICSTLDSRTWTTITTGDLETDSSNCTAGVTYCGDGVPSNGFCCGDDTSENYRTGGIGSGTVACCDASTDCVESGLCRATGYLSTSTCQSTCNRYLCSSGSWTGSACSGSVTCSGGSCTEICEADCTADTWADAKTRGSSSCGAGGTNGCPSGSRCCAGNGTYGTSCKAYDDDNSSAICNSLDGRTWTTVTTGDLETDSNNCTAGVTYCGDGVPSNGFCCGDDTSENYVTQGVGSGACCDSASDCVDSGNVCRSEYPTEVSCSDGIDNDCDDLIDSADTDCAAYTPKSQNWRWYDDEWDCDSNASTHDAGQTCPNSVNGSALANENTVATGIGKMNALKLRSAINETGGAEGTNVKMRLQYATKVGGDCNDGDESFNFIGPSSGWWDSNYSYRKKLTITENSGGDLTNYTVSYTFDHADLVTNNKSLASGNDIRIVNNSGTQIDRVIDYDTTNYGWNKSTTRIWFQVASLSASSTVDYYMYYDYDSAGAPTGYADGADVYVTYDDFEDGDATGWTAGNGTWAVETDGDYAYSGTGNGSDDAANKSTISDSLTSYVLMHRYKVVDGSGTYFPYFGTYLRYESSSYWIRVDQYTAAGTAYLRILKADPVPSYTTCASTTVTAPSTTEHIIKIIDSEGTYTVDVDGNNIFNGSTCTGGVGSVDAGAKGILANQSVHVHFDDFSVRKYVSSEPTVTAGTYDESNAWRYYDGTAGTNDSDNTAISINRLSDSGSNYATHNEVGDSATAFDHTASTAFEWEFSLQNYNGTANTSYCFRIYDNTNAAAVLTNTSETLPELTTASAYDLSMDAPTSATMPNYQLGSGTSGSNSNQFTDKDISVWDKRGTGAGWALTATSDDWSSGSDTILDDHLDWTTDTIKAEYAENTACAGGVGVCGASSASFSSEPVTIMDADTDASGPSAPGWGGYVIDDWTLRIINIDARLTGTYTGTISFSLT